MSVSPQNAQVETPTLCVTVFGDGAPEEVVKVKRGQKGGALIK